MESMEEVLETQDEVLETQEELLVSEEEMFEEWVEVIADKEGLEVCDLLPELEGEIMEVEGAPVEEAPVEEAPVEEALVEEAPVEEVEGPVVVEEAADDTFEYPGRVPKAPAPPAPGTFPTFSRGPLSVMEKIPKDLTWYLRRALQLFHPKENGSFGKNRNRWWSVRVPTSRLTSSISRSLVADMDTFAPSDFLPWSAMYLPSKFHAGPG